MTCRKISHSARQEIGYCLSRSAIIVTAMDPNSTKLGRSIQVPFVQELAKETRAVVPPRYVRLDDDHPTILSDDRSSMPQLPVVDMHKLDGSDLTELDKLHKACQEWGFFQLINHGVDAAVVGKMKSEMRGFFDLPIEEKRKFRQEEGDVEGYGQAFVVSEDQKLDWGDMMSFITSPHHLRKPHLIPKLPESFREVIDAYGVELKALGLKILIRMVEALHMKSEDMEILFRDGTQVMRMNYYPPCPQPEMVTGLCPHSDAVGLTILLQANEMDGLHVKKDGIWIPVSPLPDAFVVNVGDILEIVTNGAYQSLEHCATVNSTNERLSIATFLSPILDGEIGPAPSLVTPETPAMFKRITTTEYLRGHFSRELKGKSYVDAMMI